MKKKLLFGFMCLLVAAISVTAIACGDKGDGNSKNPPAHVHSAQHTAALAPTCTTVGNVDYWYCPDCGKYFSDGECTEELTGSRTLPAGHTFPTTYQTSATEHWRKCEKCTEEERAAHDCGNDNECDVCGYKLPYTPGLQYENIDSATCKVTGVGTATAKIEIIIPDTHDGRKVVEIGDNAFENYSNLTSITIPASVTSIGESAFENCSKLTSITIPANVTAIGARAFFGCSGFTSITIPASVTSIGENAFFFCNMLNKVNITDLAAWCNIDFGGSSANPLSYAHNLYINGELQQEIAIPQEVEEIKAYTFAGCNATSITIHESVTSIGGSAFSECTNLQAVNWNATNCAEAGSYGYPNSYPIFTGCTSLTTVNIGENVQTIPAYAFYDCSNLTSITIPASVTSIGESAFASCTNLQAVNWNATNCNKAGSSSIFSGRTSLTTVNIGENVQTIPAGAFYDCSGLTKVNYLGDIAAWCNIDFGSYSANPLNNGVDLYINDELQKEIIIPQEITEIKAYAFYGCTSITSVTIHESITSIGNYAFRDCTKLQAVNWNATNCNKAGSSSIFSGRTSLTTVNIGENVQTIPAGAFYDCSGLTKVNYLGDIAAWCNIDFGSSSANPLSCAHNLYINDVLQEEITIPQKITEIKPYTFEGCTSITSVTIQGEVTSIGNYAFRDCSSLTSITLPASITSIGDSAFFGCTNLRTEMFAVDSKLESIGYRAFSGCSKLTEITIPASVTSIGTYVFSGCTNLQTVNWNATNCTRAGLSYDPIFGGCTSLTTVNIGENVKKISVYAFCYCTNLKTVNWNATNCTYAGYVSTSNHTIFQGCTSLTTVNIGENVQTIPAATFRGCTGLTSITIPASVTFIGVLAFYECTNLRTVNFKNLYGWKKSLHSDTMSGATGILSSDLQNQETAAQYLRDTYHSYYWIRS